MSRLAPAPPALAVVLGVAGAGKTSVGAAVAAALDWPFADADDFHPPANVAKMARGEGLTDADRAPWLDRLNALLCAHAEREEPLVLACSALRAAYRARLAEGVHGLPLRWVWLDAPPGVIARRLAARPGHFAGTALLPSQLAAFEPPEGAWRVRAERPLPEVVAAVETRLRGGSEAEPQAWK